MRIKLIGVAIAALVGGLASGSLAAAAAGGSAAADAAEGARTYRRAHEKQILTEFMTLLAVPNTARDMPSIRKNAALIVQMLGRRGIAASLLEADGSPPAVYGELLAPGARHTVTLYAHYDGQPVDASAWQGDPFTPVLRDGTLEDGAHDIPVATVPGSFDGSWRVYARSAGDDKAPIIGVLAAIDALRTSHRRPTVNLKLFLEGEEEAGSPHLGAILRGNADRLRTDLWLLCDGPVHQSGKRLISFGARGVTHVDITVYGPNHGLHSGAYGNWAPNPIALLTDLLAGMRDRDAHILVPGFYDDVRPVSATEQRAVDEMPRQDRDLKRALGFVRAEGEPSRLEARLLEPAINFVGIQGGYVGELAANVISSEATAAIDFRLVPDQTPATVRRRIEQYVQDRGFDIVTAPPDAAARAAHARIAMLRWSGGYPAYRAAMDSSVAKALVGVLERSTGERPVLMPTFGGSVPMYLFAEVVPAPVVGLPIANYDDNQHTANENLRLQNLWDGIEMYAAILVGLGPELDGATQATGVVR